MLEDVLVGGEAPLLVGSRDEVDPQPGRDLWVVVKGLSEVVDRPPDEDPQRARVVPAGAAHDPVGPLGRPAHAPAERGIEGSLLGHLPQRVGGGVAVRVGREPRVVRGVMVEDLEDVLLAAGPPGRGDEALDVEHVGVEEEVRQGLEVVGIGAADVRRDDDPGPLTGEGPSRGCRLRGPRHERQDEQAQDRDHGHDHASRAEVASLRRTRRVGCSGRPSAREIRADGRKTRLRTRGGSRTGAGARSSSTPARWSARSPMR